MEWAMSLGELWAIAVVFHVVAGTFVLRVAWAVSRCGHSSAASIYAIGGLLLLTLFFAVGAWDAWLQMTGAVATMLTLWTGLAQILVGFAAVALTQIVVIAFSRAHEPASEPLDLARATRVQAGVAVALLLGLSIPLFWHTITAASDAVVQADLRRLLIGPWSFVLVFLLCLPPVFLRRLWDRSPRLQAQRIVWVDAGPFPPVTTLGLHDTYSPVHPGLTATALGSILALSALGGLIFLMRAVYVSGSWTVVTVPLVTGARLAMLVAACGAVRYVRRRVFLDVVVRQGLVLAGLSLVVVAAVFSSRAWVAVPARSVLTSLLAIAAVSGAVRGCESLGRRLAARWGEADYQRADLEALVVAMARCSDASTLTIEVTQGVTDLLGAPAVFGREQAGEAVVAVGLGSPASPRGYLSVGARSDGTPFTTEDVHVLTTVATHFAGLLEACDAREAKALSVAAELRALRAQINPHFLFNALNTLADLAQSVPSLERAIVSLSDVFRYVLEASRREVVTLGEELGAIEAYLALESARHGDQLQVSIDVPMRLRNVRLPPLVLQPLVENAVGHGVAPNPGGGAVRLAAVTHGDRLVVTVTDTGVGCDPSRVQPHVGLANVRARVELAGGAYRFESSPGTGTVVTVEVPRA